MSEGPAKSGKSWLRLKFTWVGLIGLAAILGFIAAIAIPSYGDYTHRSQSSEAISLMASAKAPLAEYFQQHKKWPDTLDKIVDNTGGKYVQSVAITKGARGSGEIELTATMRSEGVDRRVRGQSVRMLSADGGMNWICKPGTMEPKSLPSSCRN